MEQAELLFCKGVENLFDSDSIICPVAYWICRWYIFLERRKSIEFHNNEGNDWRNIWIDSRRNKI